MNKVHILPSDIISKIAAGEVIERPASVVKELLENSLDAGADSIELHLKDAGKTAITIKDNGSGIGQDDLEKIFLRHATSKIQSAEDLFDIHSLGFRGEALYSVAAIADVTLQSKTIEQDTGWEIHLRGSKQLSLKPGPAPDKGTTIEVKELFFNTPARKKFLKTNTTELNQILNIFIPYSLLHPKIRFLLTHQGKTLLDLAPTEDPVTRIAATLNLNKDNILATQQELSDKNITVDMFLGDINITRSRRDMQFVFINGRPVDNKNISFHMNNVYRLIMPQGTYPFFVVTINMPAEDLDVNIHPAKREVKMKNEQIITSILRHLCENTLMQASAAKQAVDPSSDTSTENSANKPYSIDRALTGTTTKDMPFDTTVPPSIFEPSNTQYSATDKGNSKSAPNRGTAPSDQYAFPQAEYYSMAGETLFQQKQDSLQSKLTNARFVGTFIHKFLFFESTPSLLVIDQHAAAERVTYEKLIQQMNKGSVEVQNLLSPILIKLSAQELVSWEECQENLNQLGLDTTQWNDETIAVHSQPLLLKNVEKAVRALLAGDTIARTDHDTLARRACRSSIMAGDALKPEQAEAIREQLLQCLDPFTCPHGRPTVIEMSESFLDKQFLRT